ncbi:hypothetical protein H3V53_24730 [Paraburkholderia bengalensis]|uniref:Uncharacterized protein n=1 Tax=Paraburkholderia bengalensis TaxID=2747562 RepID=A0ABU8IXI8_9BURK
MSFGFRVWVAIGLMCASLAARAEYKEVWNPPEAARGVQHGGHSKPARADPTHAGRPVHQAGKRAPAVKQAATSKASKPRSAAVKTAHASAPRETSHTPAQSKPVAAASKPRVVAQSPADPVNSRLTPRELPPMLH